MSKIEPIGRSTMALARRVRVRQLEVAVAVADNGSLLQAALSLGISQPSVTKIVAGIEEILGVPIFDRLPRGVLPNAFGKAFLASARRILAEINHVEADIMQIAEGRSGSLAIGVLPSAAAGLLPAILPRFRKAYPGISVTLTDGTTDKLLPYLRSGSIDLIAGRFYDTGTFDDFHREIVYTEPLAILGRAGHPVLRQTPITRADLERYEFTLPAMAQRLSQDVDRAIAEAGLTLSLPIRSTSTTCIRECVLGGDMLTILPRLMMIGDLARGDLVAVPFDLPPQDRPAGIITLRHRQFSRAQKGFIEVMRSFVRECLRDGAAGSQTLAAEMRCCVSS